MQISPFFNNKGQIWLPSLPNLVFKAHNLIFELIWRSMSMNHLQMSLTSFFCFSRVIKLLIWEDSNNSNLWWYWRISLQECVVWFGAISWLLFALKFLTLQANTLTVIALRSNSWQWRNVPTVTNCYNQDSSASGGANMTCWYLRIANLDYPEAGNRTHRYLIAPWKWTWFSTSMIIRLSECLSIIRRFSFREREHAIAHRIHIRYIYLSFTWISNKCR